MVAASVTGRPTKQIIRKPTLKQQKQISTDKPELETLVRASSWALLPAPTAQLRSKATYRPIAQAQYKRECPLPRSRGQLGPLHTPGLHGREYTNKSSYLQSINIWRIFFIFCPSYTYFAFLRFCVFYEYYVLNPA